MLRKEATEPGCLGELSPGLCHDLAVCPWIMGLTSLYFNCYPPSVMWRRSYLLRIKELRFPKNLAGCLEHSKFSVWLTLIEHQRPGTGQIFMMISFCQASSSYLLILLCGGKKNIPRESTRAKSMSNPFVLGPCLNPLLIHGAFICNCGKVSQIKFPSISVVKI